MSTWMTIECDQCGCVWDEDDGENFTEEINICGDWYDHVCESCMENVTSCDWCENYHDHDIDIRYCEFLDGDVCDDCMDEAHEDRDEFTGDCGQCGFEGEHREPVIGQWTGIIG